MPRLSLRRSDLLPLAWRGSFLLAGGLCIYAAMLIESMHPTEVCPGSTSPCSLSWWGPYGGITWVSLLAYGALLVVGALPRRRLWVAGLFGELLTIGWVFEVPVSRASGAVRCPPCGPYITGWNEHVFLTAASIASAGAILGAGALALFLVAHWRATRLARASLKRPQTA